MTIEGEEIEFLGLFSVSNRVSLEQRSAEERPIQ
jgi:hypothetical protein